jgi:hypothetical protein
MPDKAKNEPRATGADRRTSTRFRTRALTDGSVATVAPAANKRGTSFLGTTVNVSAGGALVRTYEALTAGQELSLTLHLPEGDLSVSGTILHVEQDAVGCRLAGVRFTNLGAAPAELLARHLSGFDPHANAKRPRKASDARELNPAAGAPAAKAAAIDPTPTPEKGPLRRSIGDVRRQTTVVFPFDGQIHRG